MREPGIPKRNSINMEQAFSLALSMCDPPSSSTVDTFSTDILLLLVEIWEKKTLKSLLQIQHSHAKIYVKTKISLCPEAKDMQITVYYLLLSPFVSLSPNRGCLRTSVSLMNKLEDYEIRRTHIFIYINVMESLSLALRKITEGIR